jgi:hypothetical protein
LSGGAAQRAYERGGCGRVGRITVGDGEDAACAASDLGGVDSLDPMGLECEAWQRADAHASCDQSLHNDHVVAREGNARGEAVAVTEAH